MYRVLRDWLERVWIAIYGQGWVVVDMSISFRFRCVFPYGIHLVVYEIVGFQLLLNFFSRLVISFLISIWGSLEDLRAVIIESAVGASTLYQSFISCISRFMRVRVRGITLGVWVWD